MEQQRLYFVLNIGATSIGDNGIHERILRMSREHFATKCRPVQFHQHRHHRRRRRRSNKIRSLEKMNKCLKWYHIAKAP